MYLLQEDETIHRPKRIEPTRRDQGICYTMIQMNPNESKDLVNSSYPCPITHLGQKTSSQLGLGPFVVHRCPGVRAVWWTSHWVSVNYMSWQETKCEWTNIWSSDTNLNCEFRAITIIISYGFDQRCMGAHSATGRLCLLLVGCWCVVHDPDLQGSRTDTPLLISRTDSADFLPKSTLLRVIPTLARYSDIASDISYGSINGI